MAFKKGQYATNKERTRKRTERNEIREVIFNHYGRRCVCCGETGVSFLTIDHVNNDGNRHKNNSGIRWKGVFLYRKVINAGFPESFQVLCMNCNWSKHKNKGICEHKLK